MTEFLAGWSKEVVDLVRALGVDDPTTVQRVVVDIPADGYVTVYVKRVGAIDVPTAVEVLASSPLKPKRMPDIAIAAVPRD